MAFEVNVVERVRHKQAWSSSYAVFVSFRIKLAQCEGFELADMKGYHSSGGRTWSRVHTDLKLFFNHSNYDDVLEGDQITSDMIDRLRYVLTSTRFTNEEKKLGLGLADGMEAVRDAWYYDSANIYLEFG